MGTLSTIRGRYDGLFVFHPDVHRLVDRDSEKSLLLSWLIGRYSTDGDHHLLVGDKDCIKTNYSELLEFMFRDRSHARKVIDSLVAEDILELPVPRHLYLHLREEFLEAMETGEKRPMEKDDPEVQEISGRLVLDVENLMFHGDVDLLLDETMRIIESREDVSNMTEKVMGDILDMRLEEKAYNMRRGQVKDMGPERNFSYMLKGLRAEYSQDRGTYSGLKFDYVWMHIKKYGLWPDKFRPEYHRDRKWRGKYYIMCCTLLAAFPGNFTREFRMYMDWWRENVEAPWRNNLLYMMEKGLDMYMSLRSEKKI